MLNLPTAQIHKDGYIDLQYDPAALVWVRGLKPAEEAPRAPGVTPIPRSTGGLTFEVKARGVRFWTITAHSADLAWDEVHRLCEASGYDPRDVVLSLKRMDRPTGLPVRAKLLTNEEVRTRLLTRV